MPAIQPLGLFLVKYTIDKKWWIPVSRILNKAECNYCVTDKEWLVFKYFIQYFISIWQEDIFVVCTDHQPQRWLFSLKAPRGQIARWLEIIASYDFSIKYRKGTKHGYVDAMSQCPNPRDCECVPEKDNSALKCGPCPKCLGCNAEWLGAVNIPLRFKGANTSIDCLNDIPDFGFPQVPRQEKVICGCEGGHIAWQ